jgi:hypothetical protein
MNLLVEALAPMSRTVIPEKVFLKFRRPEPAGQVNVRDRHVPWRIEIRDMQPRVVEIRDGDTGELIDVMRIREAAAWLKELGFTYALGSSAVWVREVGNG